MDRPTWPRWLSIKTTRAESQPDQPHPPLDHRALSTVCSCLHLFPLPPSSNPPRRARQADHLTTNATATGPSPSNVKPGWNVALATQTHGKEGGVWEFEVEGGAGGKGWGGGRREQLVSFRWGTRLCETEGEGGLSPGIIRIIFKVNESHSESVWGSFDDSTHFHPSLSKICQALWLPGISDWSVLFVAADMTIILLGSSADVDNEPRQITRGMDNANFQILKRMFIDYWSRKNKEWQ